MDSSNTIAFSLNITCERNPEAKEDDPEEVRYINSKGCFLHFLHVRVILFSSLLLHFLRCSLCLMLLVYSRHLEYVPPTAGQTQQNIQYSPVVPDILIAKLRPGQVRSSSSQLELVTVSQQTHTHAVEYLLIHFVHSLFPDDKFDVLLCERNWKRSCQILSSSHCFLQTNARDSVVGRDSWRESKTTC